MTPASPTLSKRLLCLIYLMVLGHSYIWTVFPRFLESLGWSGTEVGTLYTARKIIEAIFIGIWAWRSDQTGERRLLQSQYALAACAMLALAFVTQVNWMLWALVCFYSATASCAVPLLDALTLRTVSNQGASYGQIRAFGSFGYGAFAALFALFGLTLSYNEVASLTPLVLSATVIVSALLMLKLPAPQLTPTTTTAETTPSLSWFRHPVLLATLLFGIVNWVCQTPYNLFFVSLCETRELPAWVPGAGVCAGIFAEVLLLANAKRVLQWVRPGGLLIASTLAGTLRWWVTSWTDDPVIMIAIQALHGVNFGVFLLASIAIIAQQIPDRWRARGQAAFYLGVFTLGSTVGNSLTGPALDHYGVVALYQIASGVQLGLTLLAFVVFGGWVLHDRES